MNFDVVRGVGLGLGFRIGHERGEFHEKDFSGDRLLRSVSNDLPLTTNHPNEEALVVVNQWDETRPEQGRG